VSGGDYARVPIIVGSTRDEARSFFQSSVGWTEAQYDDFVRKNFGPQADAVLKQYPWPADATDPAGVAYQIAAIGTDNGNLGAGAIEQGIGGCATTALAAIFAKNGPVFVYEFSPRSGPAGIRSPAINGARATPRNWPTSIHCMTAVLSPQASRLTKARSPTQWLAIGRLCHSGRAEGPDLPDWPSYASTQSVLNLAGAGQWNS
jgi:para-nitrobenzyl esterase